MMEKGYFKRAADSTKSPLPSYSSLSLYDHRHGRSSGHCFCSAPEAKVSKVSKTDVKGKGRFGIL
jgi:hypothetical protein